MFASISQMAYIGYELEFYLFNAAEEPYDAIIEDCNLSTLFKSTFGEIKPELGRGQFELASRVFMSKEECLQSLVEFKNFLVQYAAERRLQLITDSVLLKGDSPSSSLQFSISFVGTNCNDLIVMNAIWGLLNSLHFEDCLKIYLPTEHCKQRIANKEITKKYLNVPSAVAWGLTNNRTTAVRLVLDKGVNFDTELFEQRKNNAQNGKKNFGLLRGIKLAKNNITYDAKNANITLATRFDNTDNTLPDYRIEFRVASSVASPHDVLETIFEAIKQGIKTRSIPDAPVFGNAFDSFYALRQIA